MALLNVTAYELAQNNLKQLLTYMRKDLRLREEDVRLIFDHLLKEIEGDIVASIRRDI